MQFAHFPHECFTVGQLTGPRETSALRLTDFTVNFRGGEFPRALPCVPMHTNKNVSAANTRNLECKLVN